MVVSSGICGEREEEEEERQSKATRPRQPKARLGDFFLGLFLFLERSLAAISSSLDLISHFLCG